MSYDVILKDPGASKVRVVKVVRACTSLSLSEVIALLQQTPSTVKRGISRWEAEVILTRLLQAGAKADFVRRHASTGGMNRQRRLRKVLFVGGKKG